MINANDEQPVSWSGNSKPDPADAQYVAAGRVIRRLMRLSVLGFLAPLIFSVGAAHAQALKLTQERDLLFGTVVLSESAVSVRVATVGRATATGGAIHIGGDQPARFLLEAPIGLKFSVTLPNAITLRSGPRNELTVRAFEYMAEALTPVGDTGRTIIMIGATAEIERNQRSGDYTGTFSILVNTD